MNCDLKTVAVVFVPVIVLYKVYKYNIIVEKNYSKDMVAITVEITWQTTVYSNH